MFDVNVLAKCVSHHVAAIVADWNPLDLLSALDDPEITADRREGGLIEALKRDGVDPGAVRRHVRSEPFVHLRAIFDPGVLPATPAVWLPVPQAPGTLAARLTAVLLNRLCGMETVAYGSENDGAPFVNLVTFSGFGALVERSQSAMRGHTDAASFPFRGTLDPSEPRIAPSPDIVLLAALRNPNQVPTMLTPLGSVVDRLGDEHISCLKEHRLVLQAQRSFQLGTKQVLGEEHLLDGANVLYDSPEGLWVRYSHGNSWVVDENDAEAVGAKLAFEAACAQVRRPVVLAPGDFLLVNNRKALHGREQVGSAVGGESRWLLRSYGLDTSGLQDTQRYLGTRCKLFP